VSERDEKFLIAWRKWTAAREYRLALFGMVLYIKPDAGPKIGAGLLR
jgi:hypothetical protein